MCVRALTRGNRIRSGRAARVCVHLHSSGWLICQLWGKENQQSSRHKLNKFQTKKFEIRIKLLHTMLSKTKMWAKDFSLYKRQMFLETKANCEKLMQIINIH